VTLDQATFCVPVEKASTEVVIRGFRWLVGVITTSDRGKG